MANKKPHLSVVVPVFNGAATLRDCAKSILQQPFTDIEVIFVNDGSQDGSAAVMAELEAQDSRVRCVHQNNQGLPLARNAGLQQANGRFVSFVDCDDLVEPNFYTSAFEGPTPATFDLFVSGMDRFAKEKILPYPHQTVITPVELFEAVFCSNHVGLSVCNKIFDLELMQAKGIWFKPIQFAEDIVFLSEYLSYTQTVVYTPQSLYSYTITADSMTNSAKNQRKFKPRDYEILDALDLARQSDCHESNENFRLFFAVRAVRSALRLLLLMAWCREDQPHAVQRAREYIRSGLSAFIKNPHTSGSLKMAALIFALLPQSLLLKLMALNKRFHRKSRQRTNP
jgi:glycosyltransferase involved in cell wall biosynthesis